MNTYTKVYGIVSGIFLITFLIYVAALGVKNSICQSSFGPELNQKRKSLHIPIIPASWHIYQKGDTYTIWFPKERIVKGHGAKDVVYHGCELDEEEDRYYFDLKIPHDTLLEIHYQYINSKRSRDSTTFIFQIGYHADTISKKMADSILKVHKTNLD